MHNLVVELTRVLEHDGTDRGLTAPLPKFLAAVTGNPKGIECVGPRWVGSLTLVQGGKLEGGYRSVSGRAIGRLQGFCAKQLQGTGNRLTELILIQPNACFRLLDKIAKGINLTAKCVLTLAVTFELVFDRLSMLLIEV